MRKLAALAVVWVACGQAPPGGVTVAEVQVVRPAVRVAGVAVGDRARVGEGSEVTVADGGSAWLAHDGAARMLLDGGARATVLADGVHLDAGRLWIDAAEGAHARLTAGDAVVDLAGAGLSAEKRGDALVLQVVRGTVAFRAGGRPGQARAGERAEIGPRGAEVRAEPLWDDWTGGLAWPDPAHHAARTLGEIGARAPGSLGEARFPLAVTRLEVRARVEDDLATTQVIETFFNPASETLEGLYRVRIPDGALLQRFAIDRDGRWADGYVKERQQARAQYQAQVYAGSTHDPALLEWDAPGSFRARIYPIPAGATRRVLVEYTEWLPPHGDGMRERTWRLPMPTGPDAPLVQELDVEVDAARSGATTLRAGLDARVEGQKVVLARTDFRPRADLVVDLVGPPRGDGARGYRAPHHVKGHPLAPGEREDDYFLALPVVLPSESATERPPLDVVIVTDVSAGTDATHLQMARTVVAALLAHLDARDRVAVVGADLDLHPLPGGADAPKLAAATPEATEHMLDALARAGTGGATDLGATLTQAAGLLQPGRRGAVVYVGDGAPTVGELDVASLRDRLDRLPVPLRLYGVAVGDDADLALLSGLADGGLAMRVDDRVQAADAALRVLGHLSRRALFRAHVDLGSGVDRVYPRRPVAVVEGEPLPIAARVRSGAPTELQVSGVLDGKPFVVKRSIATTAVTSDDLRLRWSSARLAQLLAEGGSAEEVAELGVRQNLITPFTSFYVPSADELKPLEEEEKTRSIDLLSRNKGEEGKMGKRLASKYDRAAAPASRDDGNEVAARDKPEEPRLEITTAPATSQVMPPPAAPEPVAAPTPVVTALPKAEGAAPMANLFAGKDEKAADNGLLGALAGDQTGIGGLGLRGVGAGGGGTGEGSYRRGAGHAAPADKSKSGGRVAEEQPIVTGDLDKEAVRRVVRAHLGEVRACYERALARRPALEGRVVVRFTVAPSGHVAETSIASSTLGDGEAEACVAASVRRWVFPGMPGTVVLVYPFVFKREHGALLRPLPSEMLASAGRFLPHRNLDVFATDDDGELEIHLDLDIVAHRPKRCSPASRLDLDDRLALWRERLGLHGGVEGALEVWQDASSTCELRAWSDRRALLRAMLAAVGGAPSMVQLYHRFDETPAEQDFLRRAILGQVRTAADLRVVYDGLGLSEDARGTLTDEVIARAKTVEARVAALEQLLVKWPDDLRLQLKLIDALEAARRADDARRLSDAVRRNPAADAQARTLVGEFLARQGDLPAARRAFSEIVEFAPRDPLARRRLGDLYRAHGWFDEAGRQYQTLAALAPGDPAVPLLQASAAAGAGRVDEALRLEQRVAESTEPGAEAGVARVALWWSTLRQLRLREAARSDETELAKLMGRARRTGVLREARPFRAFLTWAHPEADCELLAQLPGGPLAPSTEAAPEFGIEGVASRDPLTQAAQVVVRRSTAGSELRYDAELTLVWNEGEKNERVQVVPLKFAPGVTGYRFSVDNLQAVQQ